MDTDRELPAGWFCWGMDTASLILIALSLPQIVAERPARIGEEEECDYDG